MKTFADYIVLHELNHESDFTKLAQAAVENYYLIPYPNSQDKRPHEVNRRLHGAVHVTSVARHVEMFLELYQKYAPELLINPDERPLSEREIKLLKLAAIYHDSANTSESFHDEHKHAERFSQDMSLLGFNRAEIQPFNHAIQFKDSPEKSHNTIYKKLIHDADCLDIIRLVGDKFEKERLESLADLQNHPGFLEELEQIIANLQETTQLYAGADPTKTGRLHLDCEFSDNCYEAICTIEKDLLLSNIILHLLYNGYDLSIEDIETEFSILDLYNRANSVHVYLSKILDKVTAFNTTQIVQQEPDQIMQLYATKGVLVRTVAQSRINLELNILNTNAVSLNKAHIHTPSDMRAYIKAQSQINPEQVFTPSGFKWRPCALITEGVPINFYGRGNTFIIDPEKSMPVYFYKKNVESLNAAMGKFDYASKTNGKKDKYSTNNLREKLIETGDRLTGRKPDPNYKYYGRSSLPHNEVLVHYAKDAIIGFIVGDSIEETVSALLLRAKIGFPLRPLYRYSIEHGFIPLSLNDAVRQTGFIGKPKDQVEHYLETRSEQTQASVSLSSVENYRENLVWVSGSLGATKEDFCKRSLDITFPDKIPAELLKYTKRLLKKYGVIRDNLGIRLAHSLNGQLECTISDNKITMNFSDYKEDLKVMNRFICDVIKNIDEIILGRHPEHELLQELENLDIRKIGKIQRTFSRTPSTAIYTFQHPNHSEVTCTMQMSGTKPIVSIHASDGTVLSTSTVCLPIIAKEYFRQICDELNELIKTPAINESLSCVHLSALRFELYTGLKNPLVAVFARSDTCDQSEQIESLLKLLELNKPQKLKADPKTRLSGEVSFVIEELDSLETIKNKWRATFFENPTTAATQTPETKDYKP